MSFAKTELIKKVLDLVKEEREIHNRYGPFILHYAPDLYPKLVECYWTKPFPEGYSEDAEGHAESFSVMARIMKIGEGEGSGDGVSSTIVGIVPSVGLKGTMRLEEIKFNRGVK